MKKPFAKCRRLSLLKNSGNAISYRAFPLFKQSTGLFENSPFAERPKAKAGRCPAPHPEALPLDSAKGE